MNDFVLKTIQEFIKYFNKKNYINIININFFYGVVRVFKFKYMNKQNIVKIGFIVDYSKKYFIFKEGLFYEFRCY